jgi:hypothetical protein
METVEIAEYAVLVVEHELKLPADHRLDCI